jgi:hypothetical protein
VKRHDLRRGLLIILVLGLFVTVACDLPDILDFVLGRDHNATPTTSPQENGVLSYYGTGSTDTTMEWSNGPVTCHNETGYATLKIYPANSLPPINTHLTRDLAANESFFTASLYSPYKAIKPDKNCDYWPEGSYNTVTVNGIFITKTNEFTPVYTDSDACPNAAVLQSNGQTMVIDYQCLVDNVMKESYHFELSLQANTTKKQ